jgi:rhomboid family protein
MVANVLVFLWQLTIGINLSALVGGVIPYEVMTFRDIGPRDLVPPPFTVFTSMFLHGGLLHLGGNMLFLWVFGPNVEDVLGRVRFLGFYLASGVAAAVAHTLLSVAAGDPLVPMVGASGAIAGVMGAYLVLFPRARVFTAVPIFFFIRFMHLPASFFIGLWFVLQMLFAFAGDAGSGVAFFAHIGGFVFGWVVMKTIVLAQARRRGARF